MSKIAGNTSSPVYTEALVLSAGDGAGVILSYPNWAGTPILIQAVTLDITTQSTGACTLDIGIAADATTSNDGLIDGLSGATAGIFTNAEDPGTNGEQCMKMSASQFFNIAEASGDVTGLVGTIYVQYTYQV